MKNKGMNNSSSMIPVYTIHPPIFHMCNKFQPSRPHSSREKCDETFSCLKIGEKEKMKNKGNNVMQQPDCGTHDTCAHCPSVYLVSIFYASQFLRKVGRNILCLKIREKEK